MVALTEPGRLIMIGAAGLAATALFTITLGPHSPARIETRVEAAAQAALAEAGATYLTATAHGQRVDLDGVVPTTEARDAAIGAVRGSLGSGGHLAGGVTKVITRLVEVAPPVSPYQVSMVRTGQGITISGFAPSRNVRTSIEDAATLLFGETPVETGLDLAFGAPDGVAWDIAVIQGLEALNRMSAGEAVLTDTHLVVRGEAPTQEAATDIAVRLMLAGGGVTTDVLVTGPPEWTVSHDGSKLVLDGRARSEIAAGALAAATRTFVGDVESRMKPGPVGGWQARALLALPHFTRFARGEIAVRGEVFEISGEAPPSVLAFLREDMERLPDDGYRVDWRVTETAVAVPEIDGIDLSASAGDEGRAACETAFTRVMASGAITFRSGGAEIDRDSGELLDKLAVVGQACSAFRVEVQGHTDNRGRRAANVRLSRDRAEAVRDWLLARGLEAERVTATGFGPDRPAASNRTEDGRSRNRRIEFRVSSVESR